MHLRPARRPSGLVTAVIPLVALALQIEAADGASPPDGNELRAAEVPETGPIRDIVTTMKGPLQQRLDEAFPGSLRVGVDIFWEAGESWVSPEVLDWWSFRVDPVGLTPEGAERMFEGLPARQPVFPGPGSGTSCAVVGASRNLFGAGQGASIDAHDVVFRVNRAPTDEFAADVGTTTTHHVMWPTHLGEDLADRTAFLLVNPMTLHTPHLFNRILHLVEEELRWNPMRVRLIHPAFVRYLHRNWMEARGGFPSTGFIALMIAVHVCDEVDVFGFGADADGRWDRYYEDDPAVPTDQHPAVFEGWFRVELDEKDIVEVHLGNRTENGVALPGFRKEE